MLDLIPPILSQGLAATLPGKKPLGCFMNVYNCQQEASILKVEARRRSFLLFLFNLSKSMLVSLKQLTQTPRF